MTKLVIRLSLLSAFFPNADEAMSYYNQTNPIAAKEIFPWLQADKFKFFFLSPDHLKRMMEEEKNGEFHKIHSITVSWKILRICFP